MRENMSNEIQRSKHIWRIKVKSKEQAEHWFHQYFEEARIKVTSEGTCIMAEYQDLSAVYGFILRLRDLALSVYFLQVEQEYVEQEREQGKKENH